MEAMIIPKYSVLLHRHGLFDNFIIEIYSS